jgi:hypothetical protein
MGEKSLESFEQVRGSAMPVMQPPIRSIEVSDPHNVAETFINGPFNIVKAGGELWITRPETMRGRSRRVASLPRRLP